MKIERRKKLIEGPSKIEIKQRMAKMRATHNRRFSMGNPHYNGQPAEGTDTKGAVSHRKTVPHLNDDVELSEDFEALLRARRQKMKETRARAAQRRRQQREAAGIASGGTTAAGRSKVRPSLADLDENERAAAVKALYEAHLKEREQEEQKRQRAVEMERKRREAERRAQEEAKREAEQKVQESLRRLREMERQRMEQSREYARKKAEREKREKAKLAAQEEALRKQKGEEEQRRVEMEQKEREARLLRLQKEKWKKLELEKEQKRREEEEENRRKAERDALALRQQQKALERIRETKKKKVKEEGREREESDHSQNSQKGRLPSLYDRGASLTSIQGGGHDSMSERESRHNSKASSSERETRHHNKGTQRGRDHRSVHEHGYGSHNVHGAAGAGDHNRNKGGDKGASKRVKKGKRRSASSNSSSLRDWEGGDRGWDGSTDIRAPSDSSDQKGPGQRQIMKTTASAPVLPSARVEGTKQEYEQHEQHHRRQKSSSQLGSTPESEADDPYFLPTIGIVARHVRGTSDATQHSDESDGSRSNFRDDFHDGFTSASSEEFPDDFSAMDASGVGEFQFEL
ncbi:unnamed protein product [Chrysoparadoxa australica]